MNRITRRRQDARLESRLDARHASGRSQGWTGATTDVMFLIAMATARRVTVVEVVFDRNIRI
jgi:ethanolamine utilization microcompartment shell protein EutL